MREQKGYIFRKGKSWFIRYADDVFQSDGTVQRKLLCKKLNPYDDEHRTRASVRELAEEFLAPVNSGVLDPKSTALVSDFVENVYLPEHVEKRLRPASQKQAKDVWRLYLKPHVVRFGLTLRDFRTMHAQQILDQIAEKTLACHSSLKHCKSFLSGAFTQAKRLGYFDGFNPVTGVAVPTKETDDDTDTHAHSLDEIKIILSMLTEPTRTIILTASCMGLRKSELLGIRWEDFDGKFLSIERSVWNGTTSRPKTKASKAPIPVIELLAEALEAHRERMGKFAVGPIFASGKGTPLNLDNLASRVIRPALQICKVCRKREDAHKPEGHLFGRDEAIPSWHGWHAFRRGLATNLHLLGVDDKTIQAILRHSTISLTQNIYIKSVPQSRIEAMDLIGAELENDLATQLATPGRDRLN